MTDEEIEESILDWTRDRFDRWPIEGLHLDARYFSTTLGVSRKRADLAIRALSRRQQIEAVQRTEEEIAAGVPFLHRLAT
ncbi:MAG: hypothetical protein F4Z31_02440 [Gemmatimonadetes bacterium]|nr:hypothetical protein [Gemmatimonadota bacterium]